MYDIHAYCQVVKKLRNFFQDRYGFVEVPTQSRLSILAACEDPKTISRFNFDNTDYPLPQTGQMWLEYEMLKNPDAPGVFCMSTSYRDEPNPIEGRHDKIFPMFEFEAPGDIHDLRAMERELVEYLGFPTPVVKDFEELCQYYGVEDLDAECESKMRRDFGNAISLENFPERTSPFWNMKHGGNGVYNKIDVILCGMETIGSAERETDVETMREKFYTISDGEYADLLLSKFEPSRVKGELEDYLSLPFFQRYGGGIGVTRLARAMQELGLLDDKAHQPVNNAQTEREEQVVG